MMAVAAAGSAHTHMVGILDWMNHGANEMAAAAAAVVAAAGRDWHGEESMMI